MWVCLNDAFLSIVKKDCGRDELLVRARRRGDIEKIFPTVRVIQTMRTDYAYRAAVRITEVVSAMTNEVNRIVYDNFKDAVEDDDLHDAYVQVWLAMAQLQPVARTLDLLRHANKTKPKPRKHR